MVHEKVNFRRKNYAFQALAVSNVMQFLLITKAYNN